MGKTTGANGQHIFVESDFTVMRGSITLMVWKTCG